jgi:hypothetical protein
MLFDLPHLPLCFVLFVLSRIRTNDHYLGVICYGTLMDGSHFKIILGLDLFNTAHSAGKTAQLVEKIITKWDLTFDDFVYCVSDNASTMVACARDHLRKTRIPCFAHWLQLSIKDTLGMGRTVPGNPVPPELVNLLKMVRTGSTHFKKSHNNMSLLQEQAGVTFVKPKIDMEVRWNTTYDMLKRWKQLKAPLW